MSAGPAVTIAGGGIAGLTAALRLAERGYRVTVYEQKSVLGGDLASRSAPGGAELDVYPHMYCSWYENFWRLQADTSQVERERLFAPMDGYAQLRAGDLPHFTYATDIYSPWHIVQNVLSGIGPPADLYVFGYATIDLLAETLNPTVNLNEMSITGFLNSRPYMTDRAAAACDTFITRVWGIPSYLTSADDFRQYLQYSLADPTPAFWLPRGPAQRQVIGPLTAALEAAGVEIHRQVQLTHVSCDSEGRVTGIGLQKTRAHPRSQVWVGTGQPWTEEVDELVLAVPPAALVGLIRDGGGGDPIVALAPELAEVARFRGAQVPIINLYFQRKLRRLPAEPVGLFDSRYCLAFTDISQTWEGIPAFAEATVLAVSASDPYALPGTGGDDDSQAMLIELARYLDFEPGATWGASPDIDWGRTRYHPNTDALLFVNETGTDAWRPPAHLAAISNLSFAGDFCDNDIGLTTIESAVTTGLQAAQAIVARRGVGAPVEIAAHGASPIRDALYVWLRYAWAPYVGAASLWSRADDCAGKLCGGIGAAKRLLGELLTPAAAQRRDS